MSPALADNALRLFLIILALLLAVSVLEVLRHPPEEAAPADDGGPSL